jgi:alcohol dehydrogenase
MTQDPLAHYRVWEARTPGAITRGWRQTPTPGPGEVLIAVEACGVCGADLSDIDGADPALDPPRVPGHEVVGRILALGPQVAPHWREGQRVDVGRLGGPCHQCPQCASGRFELCRNQPFTGASRDGGYAELMTARAAGLVAIPEALDVMEAAPLLCAGIATFNALKKCGAEAGDTVAILGVGGLGHMAIQYARRMGFRVVAVGRGQDITQDALSLGAHVYLDTRQDDVAAALHALGGAAAIIATITDGAAVSALIPALAPGGRLVVLGAGKTPLTVPTGALVGGEQSLLGSITGTPHQTQKTLDFSVLVDVRPWIETVPFDQAPEALAKVRSGNAKFRMVLTTQEA